MLPNARLEVAVDDSESQRIIDAISDAARTGKIGDGKIFVTDLPETIRIRTGETGVEAI